MRFPENDQVLLSWLRLAPAAEVAEFLSCEREPKSFWDWDDPLPSGALTEILARDDSFLNLVVATYGLCRDIGSILDAGLRPARSATPRQPCLLLGRGKLPKTRGH